jgi:hypothetical protein
MRHGCLGVLVLATAAALPAGVAGATSASGMAAAPHSGIAGRVVEGPTCPVERMPPGPRCAPRPLEARVRITRSRPHSRSLVVKSGSNGRFKVALAPGTYVVQGLKRGNAFYPRPPSAQRVTVTRGHYTAVTITYDTGIR